MSSAGRPAALLTLGMGTAMALVFSRAVTSPIDYTRPAERLLSIGERLSDDEHDLLMARLRGSETGEELARQVQQDILPTWRAARAELIPRGPWPEPHDARRILLSAYADARERAFISLVQALRSGETLKDPPIFRRFPSAPSAETPARALSTQAGWMDGRNVFGLLPSCTNGTQNAEPMPRIKYFADKVSSQSTPVSICDADLSTGLTTIARELRRLIETTCLAATPLDIDPVATGGRPTARCWSGRPTPRPAKRAW